MDLEALQDTGDQVLDLEGLPEREELVVDLGCLQDTVDQALDSEGLQVTVDLQEVPQEDLEPEVHQEDSEVHLEALEV